MSVTKFTIMDYETIANEIADESVIEYTKEVPLSPEEAFRLNQILFRKTLEVLSATQGTQVSISM